MPRRTGAKIGCPFGGLSPAELSSNGVNMLGRRFLIASIAIASALTAIFVIYVWAIP
jgi:hypothetical protein